MPQYRLKHRLKETTIESFHAVKGLGRVSAEACALVIALSWATSARAQLSKAELAQLAQNADQPVIVILKSQHPVAPAGSAAEAAREEVIDAEQAPLMSELSQMHATNVKTYHLVSAFAATVSKDNVARLKVHPAVALVVPDVVITRRKPATATATPNSAASSTSLPLNVIPGACGVNGAVLLEPEGLGLTYTDSDNPNALTARSLGLTGAGVKVAFIADGVDPNNINFIRPDGTSVFVDYENFTGYGPGEITGGDEAFLDSNTIAGQGIYVYDVSNFSVQPDPSACNLRIEGVAPGASLGGLDVFGTFEQTTNSNFLQAIEYAVQTAHVDVLNESFGVNNFPDITALDLFKQFNDAAVAAGVVVSVSSGDAGSTNTIASPASDPLVISAGASTDFRALAETNDGASRYFATTGWLNDNISAYSSGGFEETGATIDLVAPGEASFTSCDASPAFYECVNFLGVPSDVQFTGGTSESAPYASGAAALVIEAYRKTHGGASPTPALVKQILVSSVTDLGAPATEQGAGLLNSYNAVVLAESVNTADGSPKPAGNALLLSANQLNAVGAPGTPQSWEVTVTNSGALPQIVNVSGRTLGPNQNVQTGSVVLNDATSRHYVDEVGVEENYAVINFQVPSGVDRLDASIAYPQTNPNGYPVHLPLIDPQGRFAAYSVPQGIGNFGNVDIISPAAGTWTGIISGATLANGGVNGAIPWQVETQQFVPFGSVQPSFLVLAPNQSQTVTVTANTPSSPGDAAGSIVLTSDFGPSASTSIPVTLRSLINVAAGGAFSGVLTGGNGRAPNTGQQQYYQFDVPPGVLDVAANLSLSNDAADPVGAYLISPDGDTLGYGQNSSSLTGAPSLSLAAYTLNPVPGTWTLVVDFAGPVVGNEVSQTFTGNIRFNNVSASAPGLPNSLSTRLAAGTPVTIPVTFTNPGAAAEYFFIDPRLDSTASLTLATQLGTSETGLTLPLPLTESSPFWLVPTETSSVSVSQSSSVPAMFDWGNAVGDPDISPSAPFASLCSSTESASFSPPGGIVTTGLWYATPSECGPYASPAPAATASLAMTAQGKAFDPAVTSVTGDLWPAAINPAATFSPVLINPGETTTIYVTITPSGPSGTVVQGTLYIDDYVSSVPPYEQISGDELAAIPYSYTIK